MSGQIVRSTSGGKTNELIRSENMLPPAVEQAKNFAGAVAKHMKSGFKKSGEAEEAERIRICAACEFLRDDERCSKCGCFMKVKARWSTSECPVDKW